MAEINFAAPPTGAEFMKSDKFFRILAGPVGSGKTVTCVFELLRRACEQAKAPDGIRYTRFAILRQTLEQLRMTILKDIQQWVGKISTYKVSDKTVTVQFGDVHSEWLLIPMEDPEDQRRLLSSQLTGAWMSEAIEMSVDLVGAILGRCGRYPSGNLGGATWFGAIADTNLPAQGGDWHRRMAVDTPENWGIFIQPGGLEENAENLEWLTQTTETLKLPLDDPRRREQGRNYYRALLGAGNADWVTRYVHAKFGADPSGSSVFRSSFKRDQHVVEDLAPVQGHNLIIAQDFGRNPFGLIGQVDHRGRLLILEELEAEDIGLALHVQQNLRPALLQEKYIGLASYLVGDPSGVARGGVYDDSPFTYLKAQGFNAYPAPTNDIDKRILAVEQWLIKKYPDGPALLIDGDRCPKLVTALGGMYRFGKRKNGQLNPLPDKTHPWSDVCFVAGTPIATPGGDVPVEALRVGDIVLTHLGPRRVEATGQRLVEATMEVLLSSGIRLRCTPEHPFYVDNDWVPAYSLRQGSVLEGIQWHAENRATTIKNLRASGTTATVPTVTIGEKLLAAAKSGSSPTVPSHAGWRSIIETAIQATTAWTTSNWSALSATLNCSVPSGRRIAPIGLTRAPLGSGSPFQCMSRFGPTPTARCQPDTKSTIRTATPQTTPSTISNCLPAAIMPGSMLKPASLPERSSRLRLPHGLPRRLGMVVPRAWRGIASRVWRYGPPLPLAPSPVPFAPSPTRATPISANAVSVACPAKVSPGGVPAWMTRPESAPNVPSPSPSTAMPVAAPALIVAAVRPVRGSVTVFNLRVADAHTYYAGGALVHNCDALQYLCLVAGSGMGEFVANRMVRASAAAMVSKGRQRVGARGWT